MLPSKVLHLLMQEKMNSIVSLRDSPCLLFANGGGGWKIRVISSSRENDYLAKKFLKCPEIEIVVDHVRIWHPWGHQLCIDLQHNLVCFGWALFEPVLNRWAQELHRHSLYFCYQPNAICVYIVDFCLSFSTLVPASEWWCTWVSTLYHQVETVVNLAVEMQLLSF